MATYSILIPGKALTQNGLRRLHPFEQAREIKAWREAGYIEAKAQKLPPLQTVDVVVRHHRLNRRSLPDICALLPTFKAILDGVVDAQVLAGDGPDIVRSVAFEAPIVDGRDAVEILLKESD